MKQLDITDFPYQLDASSLFCCIRDMPDAIWLDSGKPHGLYGRFDIMSAQPATVLETVGAITKTITNHTTNYSDDDPFTLAEQLLIPHNFQLQNHDKFPFTSGLAGFFGYDLGRRITQLPDSLLKVDSLPDMRVGDYPWALVLDHSKQKSWLFFRHDCSISLRRDITRRLKAPQQKNTATLPEYQFNPTTSKPQYFSAISKIKAYIMSGDCYQANFSQHFSSPFYGDSWALYYHLRQLLPSPFSCYYQCGDNNQAILSFSPERFIKLSEGQVQTKPIKGTIARGATVEKDHENAIRLMNSPKDRAENLMIVDLLRNDLGKTCELGSIKVPELFSLESFANVHHLVSTITGQLKREETALSLLRGCFPGGSVTGAPKKRAMEIINELEACRRSAYCGSIGYISNTGRMDTNIIIRTLIKDGQQLHCWGGGGIVADSIAESEYQEVLNKIGMLI